MPGALLTLNIGRYLPVQFIPSGLYLNICKLLIFLLVRHPYSGITSTICLVPRPVPPLQTATTCQCRSLHLLSCAITHSLHYTTGLFISPSGNSEIDCATTKTDTAERSISIGRESLQVFFVIGALAYFQVPPLGGSREENWCSQ